MRRYAALILALIGAMVVGPAGAATVSDVAGTVHNLSVTGPGTVTANTETQICVFCHTPHNAEPAPGAPLWNRKLSGQVYELYSSASLDATGLNQPGGSSKLCLSCHDGTLALGTVNVLNGQADVTIGLTGTAADGTMPAGAGELTGFTRRIGTNLTNDHPISFVFDSNLASTDGELRDPAASPHIGNRVAGQRPPPVPLENGQVQCVSCHDPHLRDTDPTINRKFLRLNRFQLTQPLGGAFDQANDIVCLGCHDKLGTAWAASAHADPSTANEIYTDTAAAQRDFPTGLQVWQAACLNCHDNHTVQGARRLLREGTDSLSTPKSGGNPALEETCYQCHSPNGGVLQGQGTANFEVPDIETDFLLPRHMPITSADQPAGSEQHEITDADLSETPLKLGKTNLGNRHVECTDCHNPHRIIKSPLFNTAATPFGVGTHPHGAGHTNIASGVLRGAWGVEPIYGSADFSVDPSGYLVKKGDGGTGAGSDVSSSYLTREYQLCLKCHSDYAYDNPPNLGDSGGGTPAGTNQLTRYTNQAREFQAPLDHQGEGTAPGWATNNHRGWHPVMDKTGRTPTVRGGLDPAIFLTPWNGSADIGNQTMYCTDCHGSDTAPGTVEPPGGDNGDPWGPHGSTNDFILKGPWSNLTGTGQTGDLCFKCHNYDDYANPANSNPNQSGYRTGGGGGGMGGGVRGTNLHIFHAARIGYMHCVWCHTAVPHGWKNKALLVNLNDVGPEVGLAPGTSVPPNYTQEPYYLNSMLTISSWATSGNWSAGNCGGRMWMMRNCRNPP